MSPSFTDMPLVDVDSHVTEPPDLWSSRLPEQWAHLGPQIFRDTRRNEDRWVIGKRRLTGVAAFAAAGWHEFPPAHPTRLEDADPASWHPGHRISRLDEYGISAQVLYPNLLGFYSHVLTEETADASARLAVVQAYNDFLADFAAEDPRRLIPIMALPFWDIDQAVAEVTRAYKLGHKGILFSNAPEKAGLPPLRHSHWHPLWSLAQDLGLSINFHIGFMNTPEEMKSIVGAQNTADYAKQSAMAILSNAAAIAEVVLSGLCHRYPTLNFVSVESGFGWLPYWLETLDWQWLNSGAVKEFPDRELPSFYVKRQVYGSFWFEREVVGRLADILPDNVMFETDFPHPTSLSPGPASYASHPRTMFMEAMEGLPLDLVEKIAYKNAARIYHLDLELVAAPSNGPSAHPLSN